MCRICATWHTCLCCLHSRLRGQSVALWEKAGDALAYQVSVLRRYNTQNGGPAPEKLTSAIYEGTKTISKYYTADLPTVDTSKIGSYSFLVQHAGNDRLGQFTVEVCPADSCPWAAACWQLTCHAEIAPRVQCCP